jgi:hypothetical protein
VKVSVVMPGHIGTAIVRNSGKILGFDPKELDEAGLEQARERIEGMGVDTSAWSGEEIRQILIARGEMFETQAPMTAAEAAGVILDGVREERWRILVGEDARVLDELVRADPEAAYDQAFFDRLVEQTGWGLGI